MKRLIIATVFLFALALTSSAQTEVKRKKQHGHKESKAKTERTTTVPQKVHNIIHPKHKRYSGVKRKHKTSH
ncbi:MAG TPA: hypothetical protein VGO09_10460 [Flavisolibacter sp.]|nr:hypothetical protein [Flavisolibacter sp.]